MPPCFAFDAIKRHRASRKEILCDNFRAYQIDAKAGNDEVSRDRRSAFLHNLFFNELKTLNNTIIVQ